MKKEKNFNREELPGVELTVVTGSRKRLKDRYPDELPADEVAWEGMYNRYMDDVEGKLGRYQQAEMQLSELCRVYPEFGEVVYNMVENRMPFRAAVARVFSEEDLIPQEGEEDFEAYREAYTERLAGVKKKESQTREMEENEARSLETIERFCAEKEMDEEQKEALIGVINDHFTELLYKRISPEMLEGFVKQMSYDEDVSEAERAGEIRGRNAKIEARRRVEQQMESGDGLPGTGGGGPLNVGNKPQARSFFDVPERRGI